MSSQLPKRVRRIGAGAAASVSLLMLGACSNADQEQITRLAMPVGATDRTPMIYDLWRGGWLAAILVGIVVWGLILYAAFRFRRRSEDDVPVQTRYNLPIEILYTIAPIVMVLVFFFFTVKVENEVLEPAAATGRADHTINVIGSKWSWTFNYMNEDAVDGKTVHTVGTPADFPTLVLPVGETVEIQLSSPDVIHSFWVPSFLYKLDVVPGRDNGFSFTPTREGTYAGKCAELCGVYHSRMLFNVDIVSVGEYEQHLRELRDGGSVGLVLGGVDSTTQAGREDEVQDDDTSSLGDAE